MSNILKKIKGLKNRAKAAIDQRNTPVTAEALLACQFHNSGMQFTMADLVIWKVGVKFYYKTPAIKLTEITNMFTVSQLVYGRIKYGQ